MWATYQGTERTTWTTRTDRNGYAQTEFAPSSPGPSSVTAETVECESSAVTFNFDDRVADWPAIGPATSLLYYRVGQDTSSATARFELEPDSGAFRLQSRSCCFAFEYLGFYTVEDARLLFAFTSYRDVGGGSAGYVGHAVGTVDGNLLTIHFDGDAYWDFGELEGVYQLTP